MHYKRTLVLPLLSIMLILTGCFRQAEDSFDTVGSQNSGAITITQDVPVVEPSATSDITMIDPNATATDEEVNAASADEASATPRTISAAPTEEETPTDTVVATNTSIAIPTATTVVASSTPQIIPTATEPVFITPGVVLQATQVTATATQAQIQSTLQPTPTAIDGASVAGDCEYIIQDGDNLFRIALNNDVTLASLLSSNGLTEASVIQPGQALTIPGCDDAGSTSLIEDEDIDVEPTAIVLDDCEYEIVSGDTLFNIAVEYGATLAELLEENELAENSIIQPGDILNIPNCEDGDTDSADAESIDDSGDEAEVVVETDSDETIHTVAANETMISIARLYGVTVNSILQANTIPDPNNLTPGQQLVIPTLEDDE